MNSMNNSSPSIIRREVQGTYGHTIKPGDEIITVSHNHHKGATFDRGVFIGVHETMTRWRGITTKYVVQRDRGACVYLRYPGMMPHQTT